MENKPTSNINNSSFKESATCVNTTNTSSSKRLSRRVSTSSSIFNTFSTKKKRYRSSSLEPNILYLALSYRLRTSRINRDLQLEDNSGKSKRCFILSLSSSSSSSTKDYSISG